MAEIKRPLYFTSQFLIDRDFIAEQDYHSGLRQLHNISLHTWGIVNGLEVTPTSTPGQVEVSAGMAIDNKGQEIVLTTPQPVTISGITSGVITIKYTEVFAPEDKYTGAGLTDKYTRATPSPKLELVASAPINGSVIKLAQVKVDGGQVEIDNSVRHLASSLIARDSDLTLDSLSLTGNLSIDAGKEISFADNGQIKSRDNNHRLVFNRVANSLELHELGDIRFLTGSPISEKMKINAAGNVGVGTTNPGQKLEVFGNIKMSGTRTRLFYRGDTDAHIGSLAFYSPNGGATAIITPYDASGNNIANSTIQFGGFGSFESNTVNLAVSGKVGIGTTSLLSGLSLSGDSEKLDSGNEFAPLGIYRKNTFKALLAGYHSTGEYAYIQSLERNIAVRPLVLQPSGGNVGIGTNNPGAQLHVTQSISVGPIPLSVIAGRINVSGNAAEFSFMKRTLATWPSAPVAGDRFVWYNPAGSARLWTEGTGGDLLEITSTGNLNVLQGKVGIGTATPAEALEVNGRVKAGALTVGPWPANGNFMFFGTNVLDQANAGNYALLQDAGGTPGNTYLNSPENIRFRIGNGDQMILTKVGNVGIGTTTPAAKLDVIGAIRAGNSDIYFTEINHNHTGIGNAPGFAAIENTANFGALMILGRNIGTAAAVNRVVKLWDFLEVNGTLSVNGNINATGNIIGHGVKGGYVGDQFVNNLGETLELGDVVVIGENQSSLYYGVNDNIPIPEVDLAQAAYDTRVCGIVAQVHAELSSQTGPTEEAGATAKNAAQVKANKKRSKDKPPPRTFTAEELKEMDTTKVGPNQIGWMVTLGAFAHCKVDADIAPIKVGDLLTTSPTKGHAQKVLDPNKAAGAIIGKALGSLKKGKGKIPVIVTL